MDAAADGPGSHDDRRRWRGRLTLILLVLVFALPLAAATWLYHNPEIWKPTTFTHHGQLMEPSRRLEHVALVDLPGQPFGIERFRGRWTLLHVGNARCDDACEEALVGTRQLRLALGHNMDRVQRVYLSTDASALVQIAPLREEHPRLHLVTGEGQALAAVIAALGKDALGHIYLLDPLGNVVLRYGPEVSARDMLKDVRKLLRNSRIG
jgi:cytochrome oxidase Cu insertion factor (SCO1/SenC/PrrC family)